MPDDAVASAPTAAPPLEIAHVLFLDIVAFSRQPLNQQTRLVELLQACVRRSPEYEQANAAQRLVRIPTGDGMALVFFGDPLSAVRASIELAERVREAPDLKLRMGVHSGPVYVVEDINGQKNVTGNGINIAQRVMDCGDAGHILVSQAVAEVLNQLDEWNGALTYLGEAQVKHEVLLPVYQLSRGGVGNESWPSKLVAMRQRRVVDPLQRALTNQTRRQRERWLILAAAGVIGFAGLLAVGGTTLFLRDRPVLARFSNFTVTRLTDSGHVASASISPDGKYVAYVERLPKTGEKSVKLKQLLTGSVSQILPATPFGIYAVGFSGDSNYVLYSKQIRELGNGAAVIYKVPVLGGPATELVRDVYHMVAFSPDGSKLAFLRLDNLSGCPICKVSAPSGTWQLIIANSDGSGEHVLASRKVAFFEYGHRPSWSPDGRTIAVRVDHPPRESGIELFPANGEESRFIPEPLPPLYVEWLRDASGIVFANDGLWFQPLPNGTPQRLPSGADEYRDLTASNDPSLLVAVQQRSSRSIWIAQLDNPAISVHAPSGEEEAAVGWLSNNDLLVTNGSRLTRLKLDGSSRTVLLERPEITEVTVCGDQAIVFLGYDQPEPRPKDSKPSAFVMNSDGSDLRKLTLGHSVSCSDDGKWIAHKTANGEIAVVSVVTGDSRLVVDGKIAGRLGGISPDAKRILYLVKNSQVEGRNKPTSFVVASVDGMVPSKSVDIVGFETSLQPAGNWMRDGTGIAHLRGSQSSPVAPYTEDVWVQLFSGGPPRRVTNFNRDAVAVGFIRPPSYWSPDGKKLAITRVITRMNVVMIKQGLQ